MKVGESEGETLRAALQALVGRLDIELPHYPMIYGTADTRAAGGRAVAARPGPPRIPAHGTDWVPVIRKEEDTTTGLPLHALLSQALMAFTIDYEERSLFSLAVSATVARCMPDGALALDQVPPILGVNGTGKTSLERHGAVRVTGTGQERVAHLTSVGVEMRERHAPIVADVEGMWRDRYGQEIVDDLAASLRRVDSRLGGDLPDHVLVRHAVGRGFGDVSFSDTS